MDSQRPGTAISMASDHTASSLKLHRSRYLALEMHRFCTGFGSGNAQVLAVSLSAQPGTWSEIESLNFSLQT